MSKLVFNVRCKFNRNPYFVPLQGRLRTEIRQSEIRLDKLPGLLNLVGGSIPGHRIEIDAKKNVGRIIDRMHLAENKEKDKQVRNALRSDEKTLSKEFGPSYNTDDCLPEGDHEFSKSLPGNLATWLFWCVRMYQDGKLEHVEGDIPTLDDVRKMGDVYGGPDGGISPKPGKSTGSVLEQTGKRTDKREAAFQPAS